MEVEFLTKRIAQGIKVLGNRIEKDVAQMCKIILIPLTEIIGESDFSEESLERLRGYFRDIYWSLKMHLMFHLGYSNELEEIDELLNVVGAWGGLTNEEMNKLPDQNHVVDPGSKLVEIVST